MFVNDLRREQELGYNPACRLAFLRETETDPVDMSPFGDFRRDDSTPNISRKVTRLPLPFFLDAGPGEMTSAQNIYSHWYKFRAKQLAAAHGSLREALKEANPKGEFFGGFVPWISPVVDNVAAHQGKDETPPAFVCVSHVYGTQVPTGTRVSNAERFARQLAPAFNWMNTPPETLRAKTFLAHTRFGLLFELAYAPLTEVEGLLSHVVIEL